MFGIFGTGLAMVPRKVPLEKIRFDLAAAHKKPLAHFANKIN